MTEFHRLLRVNSESPAGDTLNQPKIYIMDCS